MAYITAIIFFIAYFYSTITVLKNGDPTYASLCILSYYVFLQFIYSEMWTIQKKIKEATLSSLIANKLLMSIFQAYLLSIIYYFIFLGVTSLFRIPKGDLESFFLIMKDLLPIYGVTVFVMFLSQPKKKYK